MILQLGGIPRENSALPGERLYFSTAERLRSLGTSFTKLQARFHEPLSCREIARVCGFREVTQCQPVVDGFLSSTSSSWKEKK